MYSGKDVGTPGDPSEAQIDAVPPHADYRGRDLRGHSFRGQNLDGADFRESDLRDADFAGASLRAADFTGAQLGVRRHVGLVILLVAGAVAMSVGATSAIVAGEFRERLHSPDWDVLASGVGTVVVALTFLALLFRRGPRTALLALPIVLVVALVAGIVVKSAFADYDVGFALVTVGIMFLLVLAVLSGIFARILASTFGLIFTVALTLLAGFASGTLQGGIAAFVLSVFMTVVARRAAGRSDVDRPIEIVAHRILTLRGTRFSGADLSEANFTGTEIVHTDMRGALVEGAVWEAGKGPSPLVLDEQPAKQARSSSEQAS